MITNVISKQAVSLEDALRQLASAVTGEPVSAIPKTQESIILYMADHINASKQAAAEVEAAKAEANGEPEAPAQTAKAASRKKTTAK